MTTTKTSKPTAPQLNLLRSLAGLEERQTRMKPIVYKTCAARGWIASEHGAELTDEGRKAAGIEIAATALRFENTTATPWG
jgi:hypothetical protein